MFSFGLTQDEVLAKNVCAKLTQVIAENDDGSEIAVKSADMILEEMRDLIKRDSLIKDFDLLADPLLIADPKVCFLPPKFLCCDTHGYVLHSRMNFLYPDDTKIRV